MSYDFFFQKFHFRKLFRNKFHVLKALCRKYALKILFRKFYDKNFVSKMLFRKSQKTGLENSRNI